MVKAANHGQTTRKVPIEGVDMLSLLGANDQNLHLLETMFDCEAYLRGNELILIGEETAVADLEKTVLRMIALVQTGKSFQVSEIGEIARGVREGVIGRQELYDAGQVYLIGSRKVIKARGRGQSRYLKMISENDIVIGIGPAGTGKTYLAVAAAVDSFNKKRVKRIILARPAV